MRKIFYLMLTFFLADMIKPVSCDQVFRNNTNLEIRNPKKGDTFIIDKNRVYIVPEKLRANKTNGSSNDSFFQKVRDTKKGDKSPISKRRRINLGSKYITRLGMPTNPNSLNTNKRKNFNGKKEKQKVQENSKKKINKQKDKNASQNTSQTWADQAMLVSHFNTIQNKGLFNESNYNRNKQINYEMVSGGQFDLERRGHIVGEMEMANAMVNNWSKILRDHNGKYQNGKESMNFNEIVKKGGVLSDGNVTKYFPDHENKEELSKEMSLHFYKMTESIVNTGDMRLIDAAVNSVGGNNGVVDTIKGLKIDLSQDHKAVLHLFGGKKEVTYSEIVEKHSKLEEDYLLALSNNDHAHAAEIKSHMDTLSSAAGKIFVDYVADRNTEMEGGNMVGQKDILDHDNIVLDINKMNSLIEEEKDHFNALNKMSGIPEETTKMTPREMLIAQSSHLHDALNNGNDEAKHQATLDILNHASNMGEYEALRYIKDNSSTGGLLGTNHKKALDETEVTVNGVTMTLAQIDEKIENGELTEDEKGEHINAYKDALKEYAQEHSGYTISIPEGDINKINNSHEEIHSALIRAGNQNNKANTLTEKTE